MPVLKSEIVEVVVFRRTSPAEFLVLKRSDDESIYPGLWQIVSGGIETGEKAYEAAMREVIEECGISPKKLYNTPLTNTFYFFTNDSVNLSPVFAAEVDVTDKIVLSNEHKLFRWLKKDEAVQLLVWPGQKEAIRKVCDYLVSDNPSRGFMEIPLPARS
ncbi:MAG TPA: NUDIX pyrophosphatase [Candidatus Kryptonia bacterium]